MPQFHYLRWLSSLRFLWVSLALARLWAGEITPPEVALKSFRVPPGFKISIFASEPMIANPVSFAFDEKGRVYVVETHRRRTSVYDIRKHPDWLESDFSFRTVEDRANFFRKMLKAENSALPPSIRVDQNGDGKFDYHDLEVESERIRLLEDKDGDGRADTAVTYAENFNTLVSGVAAGILTRQGNVWFTCIPDLWLLRDSKGTGQADSRRALLTGFGVHISYGGHDLHGLRFGPDGKIYFSIADRGFNVETGGKTFANPDSGAVMRCNPDGSEFEVVATGLRNPQELAFDQFGNLWTGDNNGDGGDKARWVYVVDGADCGWHMGWQHLPRMGAWNSEKLWELPPLNTAAYILPPIAHIGHGPAGLAFYPGTGMPAAYDNHFFLCDFPGGVHSFAVQPKGASYEVIDLSDFMSGLYPVDVDFGPDGGAYVADWIEGWEKTGKGRIYRVYDPAAVQDPMARETKKLLAQGFASRSAKDLARLLGHRDARIRQEAQFTLAERGLASTNTFLQVARKADSELARYHALWGLGQLSRTDPTILISALPFLDDPSPEVRAQTAKILGEARFTGALTLLEGLLQDTSPRVRFFAAMALGQIGSAEAGEPILQMLRENNNRDAYLLHAGVMALTRFGDMDLIAQAARDTIAGARLAAVLAMRRLGRSEISVFLYDPDPAIVLEAARAINDVPIEGAMSQLASLLLKPAISEPVLRRSLNANFRLGKLENAMAMVEFASSSSHPDNLRAEALQLLGMWGTPPKRDWIVGLWRPLPAREARAASLPLRSELPALITTATPPVRIAAAETAVALEINQVAPDLLSGIRDSNSPPTVRSAFLKALADLKDSHLAEAVLFAGQETNEIIRKQVAALQMKPGASGGSEKLAEVLERGSISEKQAALGAVTSAPSSALDQIIGTWLDKLQSGNVSPEWQLDLVEAAAKRSSNAAISEKLKLYNNTRPKLDPLASYRTALRGGDISAGKTIFFERTEAACLRCHKLKGEGGDIGPDLTGIGGKQTREYLLESILFPNNQIAAGYESVLVNLADGRAFAGVLKGEDEKKLVINSPEDGLLTISKADIKTRTRGLSAMPAEMGSVLSKRDLRSLVEFLASQK